MADQTITTRFKTEGAGRVAKDTEAVGRAQTRLGQASASSGRQFAAQANGLGGLVGVYAAAAANVFAITAAFEALGRAAQAEQIVKGTKTLALEIGQNGAQILKRVQEITQSQLTLAESSQNINIALSAGFNTQQIEALSEVSLKASRALGRNLTDAFQRVVRGAAKLEPELLDELGIFTRIDPAVREYARSLNISVNSLTNFEKRQAFVNAVITEGQRKFSSINVTTGSAQKSLEQLQVALTELAIQFGQLLSNGLLPLVDFIKNNAGVALLAFLGILQLVFGRALSSIGGFATGGLAKLATFTEGLSAKAQKSSAAVANLTGTIKEFNAAVNQRGGVVGSSGELAGTGAFAAGITRDTARGASAARKRFRDGGVSPVQQAKDIKILTKAQNELRKAGREQSLAFRDAGTIIQTYEKAQKGANAATKTYIGLSQAASVAVKGLGTAIKFVSGALNVLFFAVAGAQLIGTLFDIDLLGEIKDFFFAIRQEALNFQAGLVGAVSAAAGGATELEKSLRRLGATDEELKKIPETISEFADEAATSAARIRSVRGNAQRGAQGNLAAAGFQGSIRNFKALSEIQQELVFLRGKLTEEEQKGTRASKQNVVVLKNLIQALEQVGGASEIIGAISRELNLSNEKTASIFTEIATITDGVIVKFDALGFSVDTTQKSFADLSKGQQELIIANTLVENTLNNAAEAFDNGAATSDSLSKKLVGVNTELDKLRKNAQTLSGVALADAMGEIEELEARRQNLSKQVRILKDLETIGKDINKQYGKFGNTLDTAFAKGLINAEGLALTSEQIAENQAQFLASQTEIAVGGADLTDNQEKLVVALGKQKQISMDIARAGVSSFKLTSDEVKLIENREAAMKSIAGLAFDVATNIEKQRLAQEKAVQAAQNQADQLRKQLDILKLQQELAINNAEAKAANDILQARVEILEVQNDIQKEITASRRAEISHAKTLLDLQEQRSNLEKDIEDIQARGEASAARSARERAISQQESKIADFEAFPNLRSEAQLLEERRKLIMMQRDNELEIINEREKQSIRAAEREIANINARKQQLAGDFTDVGTRRQDFISSSSREDTIRGANQLIERKRQENTIAGFAIQRRLLQENKKLDDIRIEGQKAAFEAEQRQLELQIGAIEFQAEVVNKLGEILNDGESAFVKAVKAYVLAANPDADVSGLDGTVTKKIATEAEGLRKIVDQLRQAQQLVIKSQEDTASQKLSGGLSLIEVQENAAKELLKLTKQRQEQENKLAQLQKENQLKEFDREEEIIKKKIENADLEIKKVKEDLDEKKKAFERERQQVRDTAEERIRQLKRESSVLGKLANRVSGDISKGIGAAFETAFDNLAAGNNFANGLSDVLRSTFEKVRKSVLEETLIKPAQEKAKEFIGSFFSFGNTDGTTVGADNAKVDANGALQVFVVNLNEDGKMAALGDPYDELSAKGVEAVSEIGDKFTELKDVGSETVSGIAQGFTGLLDSFGKSGTGSSGGGLFDMIGGLFSSSSSPTSLASGGLVRRFAAGGMNRDRVPALLEPGEFVMKRSATRSIGESTLNNMNATGNAGGDVAVNITNTGTPQEATASPPRFDGEKMVVDIVMRDLRNNGPIRKSLRGGA